ncbi:MAG: phosphoribosylanthranilate isomerase [Deltaproteobacteria bacterium HGW-Deltaproteobacteria-23]|jgi:phosphoribosylanthranilate isomerase|nr:MAG: phosphoribosylanthranilate isomerase [Deltaproteobacteria bacterium HGW-Deltaproteobacteria-23]
MVKVKICGITNLADALVAVDAGADALGFVFYEKSTRCVNPLEAANIIAKLPPFIQTVGLFVNEDIEKLNWTTNYCGLDVVQLHGDETPEDCHEVNRRVIKAFRMQNNISIDPLGRYQVSGFLLDAWSPDAYGGTGRTFNWELAGAARQYGPVILAGGLSLDNVAEAIKAVQPYAVDVSSGVETAPGKKDAELVKEFIRRAKEFLV